MAQAAPGLHGIQDREPRAELELFMNRETLCSRQKRSASHGTAKAEPVSEAPILNRP